MRSTRRLVAARPCRSLLSPVAIVRPSKRPCIPAVQIPLNLSGTRPADRLVTQGFCQTMLGNTWLVRSPEKKPCPLTWGSGGSRRQQGLDGLVSVLRLFAEPSSPQRSSQPAQPAYETEQSAPMARKVGFSSTRVLEVTGLWPIRWQRYIYKQVWKLREKPSDYSRRVTWSLSQTRRHWEACVG